MKTQSLILPSHVAYGQWLLSWAEQEASIITGSPVAALQNRVCCPYPGPGQVGDHGDKHQTWWAGSGGQAGGNKRPCVSGDPSTLRGSQVHRGGGQWGLRMGRKVAGLGRWSGRGHGAMGVARADGKLETVVADF